MIGLAAVLPLLSLTVAILIGTYQVVRTATYQGIEQTSRKIATDFESRINEKLGLLKGSVLALSTSTDPLIDQSILTSLLAQDTDLREVWIRRPGGGTDESGYHRALYNEVQFRDGEFLSAPDFRSYQAALGVPIRQGGRFAGMLGVSFSLDYFQQVVSDVHLFSSGYAFLVSHEGYRIAHPDRSLVGKRIGGDVTPEKAQQMLTNVAAGKDFWFEKKAILTGKWSRQFYSAIRVGGSPAPWFFAIIAPEEEAVGEINSLFLILVAGILATLAVVVLATWGAARTIVLPLRRLAEGAEAIAGGQLDTRVAWRSRDEVGALAQAFNSMTDRLVQTLRDQEELVRQRTIRLEESLANLADAQAKIVESEKMAVLGQLTATIAHEINTPLGAIRSSASFLHQNVVARGEDLPLFFRNLSHEDLGFFRHLVAQKEASGLVLAGQEDRKRRRHLAKQLEDAGVTNPEAVADDIAFLVPQGKEEPLMEAVRQGRGAIIQKAAETAVMMQSSAIILEAADRAASTVSALVDYARIESIRSTDTIDPAKELDTILSLYYGLSHKGVDIVKEFEPGVVIRGDRDRLNQVWVNLINNALHAMQYQGTLLLRVHSGPEGPEVVVANDGPKIPEELREKIFQPFFTTKKAGEGTGLGLDICRRIVEAHKGTLILAEDGPFTTFTVSFPSNLDPDKPVH